MKNLKKISIHSTWEPLPIIFYTPPSIIEEVKNLKSLQCVVKKMGAMGIITSRIQNVEAYGDSVNIIAILPENSPESGYMGEAIFGKTSRVKPRYLSLISDDLCSISAFEKSLARLPYTGTLYKTDAAHHYHHWLISATRSTSIHGRSNCPKVVLLHAGEDNCFGMIQMMIPRDNPIAEKTIFFSSNDPTCIIPSHSTTVIACEKSESAEEDASKRELLDDFLKSAREFGWPHVNMVPFNTKFKELSELLS